jgi:uncharacterized protein DUF4345
VRRVLRSDPVRRVILGIAAVVFVLIATQAILRPHQLLLGRHLDSIDSYNEFRAIYLGLWLATAVLLVIAARRIHEPILGDLGALLILGQVFGRLVSLLVDGIPGPRIWSIFMLELAGGAAILLVRPSRGT